MTGAKLGTAYYELIPSMKGAQQQITSQLAPSVSAAGSTAARGFSTKFAALAGGVAGVAALVASKAASAIAGFVSEAVQASDATDKFKQTLAFAGLKSTAIDGLAKSTRRYADQTVYSLADIQGITAQLAANGVKGYGSLAEAAGNLNAVAGGNADTFRSVGMVLTQTAGAGKLTTENWNQLANAIPGASGKLQDALKGAGAYTGNFRDAMAKGQITAGEFNKAIMKLGMTDVAKQAATSTSTIEGAMGNLQASIVGLLSDGVSKAKPAITGVINAVATGVSAIGPVLSKIGAFLGPVFAQIGPALAPLLHTVAALAPQFLGLWATISPVGIVLKALAPVLPQIAGMLSTLANVIGGALGSVLAQVVPILSHLASVLVGALSAGLTALMPVISQLIPIVVQIATVFGSVLTAVVSQLAPVFHMLAGLLAQLIPAIMPVISAVLALIAPILSLISPLLQLIGPILKPLIGLFIAILKPIIQLVQPIIGLLVPALKLLVTGLQIVITWITQAITWFVKLVTGNRQAGLQFIAVWNGIKSFFGGIGAWFAGVWNGLINGIAGMVINVIRFFNQIPQRIAGVFAGAGQWLWNAGVHIVEGLINGLRSMAGSIGRWFLSIIPDWIKGPFMAALGIHSPSTVFHEFGQFTMQGYINGLSSMQRQVQATATQVGTLTAPQVSGTSQLGVARSGDQYVLQGLTTQQTAAELSDAIETKKRRSVYGSGTAVLAEVM